MTCHPILAGHRTSALVAPRRHLSRGQVGSLSLSVVIHVALVLGATLSHRSPARAEPTPVAFAVERSLLSHEAAAGAPPPMAEVFVEPEATPDEPHADPALEPPAEPITPPRDPRVLAEARTSDDARLRKCATTRLRPAQRPEIDEAPPPSASATEAPPAPTTTAPQVARPDVPVAIPGQNPAPDYPAFARRRNIEGTVLVRIDVDASGTATHCAVVASSGCTSLDFAALAAARRWRFVNGPGSVEVPFVFQIRG
jgi:protein TonB